LFFGVWIFLSASLYQDGRSYTIRHSRCEKKSYSATDRLANYNCILHLQRIHDRYRISHQCIATEIMRRACALTMATLIVCDDPRVVLEPRRRFEPLIRGSAKSVQQQNRYPAAAEIDNA